MDRKGIPSILAIWLAGAASPAGRYRKPSNGFNATYAALTAIGP